MTGRIPETELARRVAALPWTNQNIQLTPDLWTVPGQPPILTDPRVLCVKRAAAELLGGSLAGARVADLGCLEGGISLAFALDGAEVVGIEGRRANYDKCRLVEEHFALPNLKFELGDARDFRPERYGMFDVVLVLGLLYHLDDPAGFLLQAARCARRAVIVDTHFAPETDAGVAAMDTMPFFDLKANPIGPLETMNAAGVAVEGRWWTEYPDWTPESKRDELYWASLDNHRSFWLTRPSIYRLLAAAGFDSVGERLDFAPADDVPALLREKSRSVFVGARTGAEPVQQPADIPLRAALRRYRAECRTLGRRKALKRLLGLG